MLSKNARIIILLCIDTAFFFVELIVGYSVGSLALVADSFHMLNDVMSLVVALYAIKLSQSSPSSQYTYGWHRAEILAALINGVFLLALCFSIFMEALEKFITTPVVSNPKLVVIVGSFGLLSNIVGLFLFHDHDHSHSAETPPKLDSKKLVSPEARTETTPLLQEASLNGRPKQRRDSASSLHGHPVQNRALLLQAAQDLQLETEEGSSSEPTSSAASVMVAEPEPDLEEGLATHSHPRTPTSRVERASSNHHHSRPKRHHSSHGHGSSMNMRALVLHVIGDALGNVGVIATGLIIWLSEWKFKYYCDPIISLLITVIIFSSALPLVKSASYILLQGVPSHVSLDQVRREIREVPDVTSVHEFHIWQLSESKIVASVHVCVSPGVNFMTVASRIRRILHNHGVHSSTIQPEYAEGLDHSASIQASSQGEQRCLLRCPPDQECSVGDACCPPGQRPSESSVPH